MKRLILAVLLATSGCASYTPHPLETGSEAVLAPPVAAIVARDAVAIDRPYLKPSKSILASLSILTPSRSSR